jgi:serpin B
MLHRHVLGAVVMARMSHRFRRTSMNRRTCLLALASLAATGISAVNIVGASPQNQETASMRNDLSAVVAGNNQFAFDLYAHLAKEKGNIFLSPSSISTALAMTYAGARGQTAEEMAKTLHFTLDSTRLHPAFAALLREWKAEGKKPGYQLSIANALWGQKGFGFLPDFLNLTRQDYGAGLIEVDFAHNVELARKTINEWVEEQTRDKIKELFKPGMLSTDTRLALTNAVYFKGDWAAPFQKNQTSDQDFQLTAQDKARVPSMFRTGHYRYADGGTFQALELPYKGNDLSMLVLLPGKVDGLADLEQKLSARGLQDWLGKLRSQEVAVTLPRFKTTREYRLNDVLAAMGMPSAFNADRADFSGMNGTGPRLFISVVVHKAFVDVNEQGTEAAAATGVGIALAAAPVKRQIFRADHPFLFLIRDNRSGSILFLGRVIDPRS